MVYDHLDECFNDDDLKNIGYLDHLEDLTNPVTSALKSMEVILEDLMSEQLKGLDRKTTHIVRQKLFALDVLVKYQLDWMDRFTRLILYRSSLGLDKSDKKG